jgi:hypothetical protein
LTAGVTGLTVVRGAGEPASEWLSTAG